MSELRDANMMTATISLETGTLATALIGPVTVSKAMAAMGHTAGETIDQSVAEQSDAKTGSKVMMQAMAEIGHGAGNTQAAQPATHNSAMPTGLQDKAAAYYSVLLSDERGSTAP